MTTWDNGVIYKGGVDILAPVSYGKLIFTDGSIFKGFFTRKDIFTSFVEDGLLISNGCTKKARLFKIDYYETSFILRMELLEEPFTKLEVNLGNENGDIHPVIEFTPSPEESEDEEDEQHDL